MAEPAVCGGAEACSDWSSMAAPAHDLEPNDIETVSKSLADGVCQIAGCGNVRCRLRLMDGYRRRNPHPQIAQQINPQHDIDGEDECQIADRAQHQHWNRS